MKFEAALKRCQELDRIMTEHGNTATRASQTYTATMTLFNVAADAGDEEAMQKHRDTLHTCIDSICDAGAMLAKLQKEKYEVAQSAEMPSGGFPFN